MRKVEINSREFEIDGRDMFSPAEEITLEDWLQAMRARDAAEKRHRSMETVNSHRKTIREKTGQCNGEGVLMWCLTKGYVRMLLALMAIQSGATAIYHNGSFAYRMVRGGGRPPKAATAKYQPANLGVLIA